MAGSEHAHRVRRNQADERALVEAAQGDSTRFADLYDHYFELVYAYVARRSRGRDEAEDLTSEVFRKALAGLPRFKWTGAPFATWLFRIAANLIADRSMRAARNQEVSLDEARNARADRARQQASMEEVERQARLFQLVDDLPEDQRRVVVMRFAEEKSIREIASEMDRSEGAVKQLQFRALENLRKQVTSDQR